jgi:tRNA threonylcarbamoyladenosine biosynthesis protein TsaB
VKLLSISTSTPRGSAAILDGDRVLASTAYSDQHGHAERLFAAIDEILRAASLDRSSLEAIACDLGPGSFTGVRVGVASAKGIALALGLRVVGVTSLEAVAAAAFGDGRAEPTDIVAAVLDAKKGELFLGAFDASLKPLLAPLHVPRSGAADVLRPLALERKLVLAGELLGEILVDLTGEPSAEPLLTLPNAEWIGRIAAARLAEGGGDDAAALEAFYVRAPDAKLALLG